MACGDGCIFGAAEQHEGARGQALAQLHQLRQRQALGGVLRANGNGYVAVPLNAARAAWLRSTSWPAGMK